MPARKRAAARPAEEPTVGPPGPSGVSPDPPVVIEVAVVAAKEEASGLSSLTGTAPDEDKPADPDEEPGEPVRMLSDESDLLMDAAAAQPSDPTRCGGYALVPGLGWVPEQKEQ